MCGVSMTAEALLFFVFMWCSVLAVISIETEIRSSEAIYSSGQLISRTRGSEFFEASLSSFD